MSYSVTLILPNLCEDGDWQNDKPTPVDAVEAFQHSVQGSPSLWTYGVQEEDGEQRHFIVDMADGPSVKEGAVHQHVIIHIWDDNANVYGSPKAAVAGIADNHDEHEREAVEQTVNEAIANPGDAAYIDGGMSTVRYLHVNYEV